VRRSYFPAALPVVARNAESVRVWENSLFSQGVWSINQPMPLASVSMRRVPPLGRPCWSNWVTWASANCPVGRSVIWRVRSKGLVGSKRVFKKVGAVELMS
jgi:hypothetical protein